MPPRRVPFRVLLPLLALILSATAIAVPATLTYLNLLHGSRNGSDVSFHSHDYKFTVPRDHFLRESFVAATFITSHTIQALNLPAFVIEIANDRFTHAWPSTWTPAGMDFLTWRALVFPIYCLPFWWFVGFGLEAFCLTRRPRWWTLLFGTLLCAFFLFLVLGLTFGMSAEERGETVYALWGFGLWTLLFAIFPAAWIRSRRVAHN